MNDAETMSRMWDWDDVDDVPDSPCEYELFSGNKLIRNGSSCDCRRRLKEHRRRISEATGFKIQPFDSCKEARRVEKAYCRLNKPPMNKRCG
jgi:hypothetical protein